MKLQTRVRQSAVVAVAFVFALQTSAADWITAGGDAQRSSWARTDSRISVEAIKKSGLKLEWKLKPEGSARELNTLMPAVMLDLYIGYRGFRAFAFVASSSGQMVAFDAELGRLEWQKDVSQGTSPRGKSITCPGGITSAAARPTTTSYPSGIAARSGRGTPAKSGVGLPDEGAVTIKRTPPSAPPPVTPAATAPAAPAPVNPYAPHVQYVYTLTGDGILHSLWVSNGNEAQPGVPFIPAGADARGLLVFGDTAYVATTKQCGGVADGVWAMDLPTAQVKNWKPESGGIAGTVGAAAGPDGTLYVATTGGELVALEPKTLKGMAKQKVSGVEFTSSPVVFDFNGKNLIAVAANDGCIYMFDAAALSSPPVKSSVISASGFEPGSLTSWVDGQKNRWILAPSPGEHGSVVALKVVSNSSSLAFEEGWKSRELTAPLSPIVSNGVVFALASGEFQSTDPKVKLAKRVKNSTNAVLYALDGETGKELWNSGEQITSFVHSGALAAGDTRIYLADYEGNEYAFGIPIEH